MAWAPDYAEVSALKAYQRITDDDDAVEMALAVTAASRAVDHATNRQFGQVAALEERQYTAFWDREASAWRVEHDDVMDLDGFLVEHDDSAISAVVMEPLNSDVRGKPWTSFTVPASETVRVTGARGSVRVTARWGWTAVPAAIQQATLLQANRFMSRRDSPFGVAGSPDAGSEFRLLPRLDPDVALSVRPFYRWWGVR